MQYKVPQNVDIEDKVIGPLTLRQFMIMLIGVGVDLFLYFTLASFAWFLFFILAAAVSAGSVFLAFGKMNEQKLEIFLLSAYKTLLSPKKRVWKKEAVLAKENIAPKVESKGFAPKDKPIRNADDFQRLAELVDSGGLNNIAPKDRTIMAEPILPKPEVAAKDIIEAAEAEAVHLDPLLNQIKSPTKKEQTVAEMATVSPNQDFKYPKIDTLN